MFKVFENAKYIKKWQTETDDLFEIYNKFQKDQNAKNVELIAQGIRAPIFTKLLQTQRVVSYRWCVRIRWTLVQRPE